MKLNLRHLGTSFAVFTMLTAVEANAHGGLRWDQYKKHAEESVRDNINENTNNKVHALQLAIMETLRLATGQLSGNLREQTGAGHSLADQQDDRATVKAVEQARLDAMRDAVSGTKSCSMITGSTSARVLRNSDVVKKQLDEEIEKFILGEDGAPSSKGDKVAKEVLVEVHCLKFASEQDVANDVCQKVSETPNADINVKQTLLRKNEDGTYGIPPEYKEAALAASLNLSAWEVLPQVSGDEIAHFDTLETIAERNKKATAMSVSSETISYLMSQRMPSGEGSKSSEWAVGVSQTMPDIYKNASFEKGLSPKDFLALISRQWLLDKNAMAEAEKSSAAAIKDIRNILAVIAYQNFENLEYMERISLNLATQTGMMVPNTFKDR
ncbi:hypothetical protein [Flexibacterium corallicola]|uniref:hypothetical protein n=1 Tax=Flexibacterium corallicola TaxID=3037259 RepID=UPI00286F4CD0|nr:hypothetical protein [Pseudovibrio sp. M1P-2-3]